MRFVHSSSLQILHSQFQREGIGSKFIKFLGSFGICCGRRFKKLKAREKAEANPSTKEKAQPLKNNKRKSSHKQFTTKKKREDSAASLLPEEFKRRIIKKSGRTWPDQIICIYKNTLSSSDVMEIYSRLAMPLKKMEHVEFLKDNEKALLEQKGAIQVPLIFEGKNSPSEITLNFKHWNSAKQYVLNHGWNEIVEKDKLKRAKQFIKSSKQWLITTSLFVKSRQMHAISMSIREKEFSL
ncbi:hypothetical protein K1719_021774 [Acacia pycnantha]|nr:hypothetical protein K1719_021774 [Acacia pycnantha]